MQNYNSIGFLKRKQDHSQVSYSGRYSRWCVFRGAAKSDSRRAVCSESSDSCIFKRVHLVSATGVQLLLESRHALPSRLQHRLQLKELPPVVLALLFDSQVSLSFLRFCREFLTFNIFKRSSWFAERFLQSRQPLICGLQFHLKFLLLCLKIIIHIKIFNIYWTTLVSTHTQTHTQLK